MPLIGTCFSQTIPNAKTINNLVCANLSVIFRLSEKREITELLDRLDLSKCEIKSNLRNAESRYFHRETLDHVEVKIHDLRQRAITREGRLLVQHDSRFLLK